MAGLDANPVLNNDNDLWETAYDLVRNGDLGKYAERYDRLLLASNGTSDLEAPKISRAEKLIKFVNEKSETLKKDRWGLVISGRKFGVGDVVDNIVTGILYSKDLLDQTLRATGEPHAALAWAGVCLLLPVNTPSLLW
jgi:hypothetical protein